MVIKKVVGGAGDMFAAKAADYKDNLYLAVNGAWQEKAKISPDKSSAGIFTSLDEDIEKTLMKEFQDLAAGTTLTTDPELQAAVKLYQVVNDETKLQKFHEKPILKDLEQIQNLDSLAELNKCLVPFAKSDFPLPLTIEIDADMKNTAKNVVYVDGADLILPDKSYYEAGNESGKKLLAQYVATMQKLLVMVGYSQTHAEETAAKAVAFDQSLVPIVKSSEEWADYAAIYNPVQFDEFVEKSTYLDLRALVVDQINATPDKVILEQPRYMANLDKLINETTFENLKAWILVTFLQQKAGFLDEEFRQTIGEFQLARSGAQELPSRTKYAYQTASDVFSEVIGIYYGQKYFGEKAKADVRNMIEKTIAIYEQRLATNTWLGEATKKKAILKLEKIVIKVGYPDVAQAVYKKLKIDEKLSFYDNMVNIRKTLLADEMEQYHKPVDRTKWLMPGQMVNACYDPSRNDVTFPAGILQAPFYSLEQTSSQNYGATGATFGHEISHAFDNDGAKFDEYGNMNNWWTDEDYAKFKALTQDMIDEFDGIPFAGGKVNGKLVVSENIADIGGLRCAIEAAKMEDDYNAKEFFISWARSWRYKANKQRAEELLATDVHAPEPLRANVHAQNMDEFYAAFNVQPGDGMWLAPEKRISIW